MVKTLILFLHFITIEMDIIFDMPMDEAANSPIAYDYGPQASHGLVNGCTFIQGHTGYAATGQGYIRTRDTIVDLSNDYTVLFWARNTVQAGFAVPNGMLFQFNFGTTIEEFSTNNITLNTWEYWALVKTASHAIIYKNGTQIGTIPFPSSTPIEWAVKQLSVAGGSTGFDYTFDLTFEISAAPFAVGDLDEVLIYDGALSQQEIINNMNPPPQKLLYWIDERKFTDFGVYVEGSAGVVDALKRKTPTTVDWAGEHGDLPDLDRVRFMPREITLDCFVKSDGFLQLPMNIYHFLDIFNLPGTHRLRIDIDDRKPLVYEVYLPEGTSLKKEWRDSEFVSRFELKLIEHLPIKRVLRFTKSTNTPNCIINIDCKTPFNIYWGDGTVTKDVIGQHLLSHTYQDNKVHHVIIAGVLEDITSFTHNAILIWNKL